MLNGGKGKSHWPLEGKVAEWAPVAMQRIPSLRGLEVISEDLLLTHLCAPSSKLAVDIQSHYQWLAEALNIIAAIN